MTNNIDNILTNVYIRLSRTDTYEQMTEKLLCTDKIFSFIMKKIYKDDKFVHYRVQYNISQSAKYNTINVTDILKDICNCILEDTESNTKHVVLYKQPSLTLMCELFTPLLKRFAWEQSEKWSVIEYDDAYQMACYSLTKLYRKGYYIHKYLLQRVYENDILMSLRHDKDAPPIKSLENLISDEEKNYDSADVLRDTNAEEREEHEEHDEIIKSIFNEVKELVIDIIGERQFDQLFRDYANKHTTTWSRKKMWQIKKHLDKLGVSWKTFTKNL